MKNCKPSYKHLVAGLCLALLPTISWSQLYVVAANGTKVDVEKILVRPNGDLVVTIDGKPQPIPKEKYLRAVGVKPAEIEQAQALIVQGKNAEATQLLEDVVQSSRYQSWDAYAGEKLASLQLANGKPLEAKSTVDSLEQRYGENLKTFFPFLEKILWDVKVKTSDTVGLEDELTEVIKGNNVGERKAGALIVRGDLKASRKDYKAAVLDYLRANYFFGDHPDIQAEALYKAASMFAKIGDTGRLRKYSTLLKETYPDSKYAKREMGS